MTAGPARDLAPPFPTDRLGGDLDTGAEADTDRAGDSGVGEGDGGAADGRGGAGGPSDGVRTDGSDPALRQGRSSRPRTAALLPVAAVAVVAVALRVLWLDRQSLFVDEHAERAIAALPWSELLDHPDGFPPLWFFLAHGWLDVFGFDTSLRWLSVVLGLGVVGASAGAARVVGGPRAALATAALTAVAPLAVWHAQESRPYSLVLLLAAGLLWTFLRLALDTGGRPPTAGVWAAYALTVVAGAWTHYFFAIPVAFTAITLVALPRTRRDAIVTHVLVALGCLPLVGLLQGDVGLQQQLGTMGGSATAGPGAVGYSYLTYVAGFSVGPSNRDLRELGVLEVARAAALPLALVAVLLGALAWWTFRHRRYAGVIELGLACTVPVLVAVLLCAALGVGFRPRYVSWGFVPLAVLAGCALGHRRNVGRLVLAAVFVGLAGASLVNRNLRDDYKVEDLRAAVRLIDTAEADQPPTTADGVGDPVAVVSGYLAPVVDHYVERSAARRQVIAVPKVASVVAPPALGAPQPEAPVDATLSDALAALPRHRPFWLLLSRTFHADPEGRVVTALRARCRVTNFPGVAGVAILRIEGVTGGACDATTTP